MNRAWFPENTTDSPIFHGRQVRLFINVFVQIKNLIPFLAIVSLLFVQCTKDSANDNIYEDTKDTASLTGSWKLVKFMTNSNTVISSEPSDIYRSVMLYFEDSGDSGFIEGHTILNSVFGLYKKGPNNTFSLMIIGGTKIGEPKWAMDFWDAMQTCTSFEVDSCDSKWMKILYGSKYLLFERNNYYCKYYWDQTKCADPWNTTANNHDDTTKYYLRKFLSKKINYVGRVDITNDSDLDVTCESCMCGTGRKINFVGLLSDSTKLFELGFKLKK